MYWTTKTIYVDKDTGEILTLAHVQKKYDKLKCTKQHVKENERYGTRTITWTCEKRKQLTIEW